MSAAAVVTGLVGLLVLGVLWFLPPFAMRKIAENRLARLCKSRRAIVLTYDDGPGEILTPRLIELLGAGHIRATFYALGRNAERNPETLRKLIEDGHDVGSHTYNHTNAWKVWPWQAARDVRKGAETLKVLGGDAHAFRPPFGKLTIAGLVQGWNRGLRYGWWTIDSKDSWARRPIKDVLNEIEDGGGGVVLMHDFDTYEKSPPVPSHVDHILELTAQILEMAKQRGFHVVPMSSLNALPPVN